MLHIFNNNLSGFWSNLVFRWFRLELPMFFTVIWVIVFFLRKLNIKAPN